MAAFAGLEKLILWFINQSRVVGISFDGLPVSVLSIICVFAVHNEVKTYKLLTAEYS